MKIWQVLQQGFQSIWEGAIRVFSPSDDDYPETGVQPFKGEPYEVQEH